MVDIIKESFSDPYEYVEGEEDESSDEINTEDIYDKSIIPTAEELRDIDKTRIKVNVTQQSITNVMNVTSIS